MRRDAPAIPRTVGKVVAAISAVIYDFGVDNAKRYESNMCAK